MLASQKAPSYPQYLPHFDINEKFPPTPIRGMCHFFSNRSLDIHNVCSDFTDAGLRADPKKPNLLKEGVQLEQISPYLGTVVKGVQVSELSKEGLDELALLVAERKVVVFRDQDFKDLGFERQIEIARYVVYIDINDDRY